MHYLKRGLSRELRQTQTYAEEALWQALRNRKCGFLKFRRQHVIDGFIVDFYCSKLKLVIEIDGGVHLKQKNYDTFRQEIIENKGYQFLRFSNKEIINNLPKVLNQLESLSHPKR